MTNKLIVIAFIAFLFGCGNSNKSILTPNKIKKIPSVIPIQKAILGKWKVKDSDWMYNFYPLSFELSNGKKINIWKYKIYSKNGKYKFVNLDVSNYGDHNTIEIITNNGIDVMKMISPSGKTLKTCTRIE